MRKLKESPEKVKLAHLDLGVEFIDLFKGHKQDYEDLITFLHIVELDDILVYAEKNNNSSLNYGDGVFHGDIYEYIVGIYDDGMPPRSLEKLKLKYSKPLPKKANTFDFDEHAAAGRVWKNVKSKNGNVFSVITFWKSKAENEKYVNNLIKELNLTGTIVVEFMDTDAYIYSEGKQVETKELKSEKYPELTHQQIVDILIKAHVNSSSLSAKEKQVVGEFRGTDAFLMAKKQARTGGYKSAAEFKFNQTFGDSIEKINNVITEMITMIDKTKIISESPDSLKLDGKTLSHEHPNAMAFSILNKNVVLYTGSGTHPYIFNALKVSENEKDVDKNLKDFGVKRSKKISKQDFEWYEKNYIGIAGKMRARTNSGRVWKNLNFDGNKISVISFWGKQKDNNDVVDLIVDTLKLNGTIFVEYIDTNVIEYNKMKTDIKTKTLKSKLYPELSEEDIIDILVKAHVNKSKLNKKEKDVVGEFRGTTAYMIAGRVAKTGGYDTAAEFNAKRTFGDGYIRRPSNSFVVSLIHEVEEKLS